MIVFGFIAEMMAAITYYMGDSWPFYALVSELRVFVWISIAFFLSKRTNIFYRSLILFCLISQTWTMLVFIAYFMGHDISYGESYSYCITTILVAIWISFKNNDIPKCAIKLERMEYGKVYAIIKKSSCLSSTQVFLSLFGLPAYSMALYIDGYVYCYTSETGKYQVIDSKKYNSNNRYAIELTINHETAKKLLRPQIGSKYTYFHNCITTPIKVWEKEGINVSMLSRFIPSLLVRKIIRRVK